ncbi:MAG: hypothetical protein KJ717_09445 [Proteobacteria bacterium]|nr:hypothetical protein [Pseudomonadota bacterium]
MQHKENPWCMLGPVAGAAGAIATWPDRSFQRVFVICYSWPDLIGNVRGLQALYPIINFEVWKSYVSSAKRKRTQMLRT